MTTILDNAGLVAHHDESFEQFATRVLAEHRRRGDRDQAALWREARKRPSPASTEMTYLCCPECRACDELPPRQGMPGWYYWCEACRGEWREAGPTLNRLSAGEIIAIVTAVALVASLLFGEALLIMWGLSSYFPNTEDGRALAATVSTVLAIVPCLFTIWLVARILPWIIGSFYYLWGEPL